jgi:UDP-N-acetylmuramate--alanine ligase
MLAALDSNKYIHFVGLAGCGMLPLARILKSSGFLVSGSDKCSYKLDSLQEEGFTTFKQHCKENIKNASHIIYSSAIAADNPELQAASAYNKNILHRSDLLSLILNSHPNITIAGAHGKTTTSAMIVHMLSYCGLKVVPIVGGNLKINHKLCLKDVDYVVAEADESDGSFIKYKSTHAVVTNMDHDHPDFYTSHAKTKEYFKLFIKNISSHGSLVYNGACPHIDPLIKDIAINKHAFGLPPQSQLTYTELDYCSSTNMNFDIHHKNKSYRANLNTIGEHNIQNMLASLTLAHSLSLPMDLAIKSFASFPGVKRRLELVKHNRKKNIYLYDDYAHNPQKISSALHSLKQAHPQKQIVAIFEPHRYSRISHLYHLFTKAFSHTDALLILPVFSAGETNETNICPQVFASDIARHSKTNTKLCNDFLAAQTYLQKTLSNNSVIVCLGAGNIVQVINKIKDSI